MRVAFWKEEPLLHYAFDLVETPTVYVVPVFTSAGYFTELVLPREMGLADNPTVRAGRRILYCPPVGTHPGMARIVLERADEAFAGAPTLVIVGHGTDRHPDSGAATLALVERVRELRPRAKVLAAFLDQSPTLPEVLDGLDGAEVVVVPFFIAEGWHVGTSIPEEFGVGEREAATHEEGDPDTDDPRAGRHRVRYAKPVGTHPGVSDIVEELVREAIDQVGSTGIGPSGGASPSPSSGEPLPAAQARRAFLDWIRDGGGRPRTFLQTAVWSDSDGFEVRHADDLTVSAGALAAHTNPDDALALARFSEDGRYRSLRTAPDLRRGWRFSGLNEDQVWEVYAHLYPAAPVHRFLEERGRLPLVSFRAVAKRQTGMYASLDALGDIPLEALVERRCGPQGCLRDPTWSGAGAASEGNVPCPRPCSVFLSEARMALTRAP